MVSTADLLRVWPDVVLEDSGAFEKIAHIRDDAFAAPSRSLRARAAIVLTTRSMRRCSTSTDTSAVTRMIATLSGAPTNHTQKVLSDRAASPSGDGEGEGDGLAAPRAFATTALTCVPPSRSSGR